MRLLTSHTESLVCVDCRHPSAVTLETRKAFGGDFAARELQQKHGASRHPNQLRKFARLCTHRSVAISHYHSHCRALASPAVASIWSLSAFCLPSLHAHHTSRAQCVMAPVACKKQATGASGRHSDQSRRVLALRSTNQIGDPTRIGRVLDDLRRPATSASALARPQCSMSRASCNDRWLGQYSPDLQTDWCG